MGSNLRKYKTEIKAKNLDDGQTVGGKDRLTKLVTDKLQNYYGAAIRQNVGNLRITQDAIWAIFYHTVKAPPRHISKRTKTTFYKIVK